MTTEQEQQIDAEASMDRKDMYTQAVSAIESYRSRIMKKIHRLHINMRGMNWENDGYNEMQKYPYVTASKIKANFQKACIDAGLVYAVDIDSVEDLPAYGRISTHMRANATLSLIDIDTGSAYQYKCVTEAGDSGDKTCAKLMTMAFKSAVATNFAVSDIDPEDGYTPLGEQIAMTEERNKAVLELLQERAKATTPAKATPSAKSTVKPTATAKKDSTRADTPKTSPSPATVKESPKDAESEATNATEDTANTDTDAKKDKPSVAERSAVKPAPVTAPADDDDAMTSTQKTAVTQMYSKLVEKKPEGVDLTKVESEFAAITKNGTRQMALDFILAYRGYL